MKNNIIKNNMWLECILCRRKLDLNSQSCLDCKNVHKDIYGHLDVKYNLQKQNSPLLPIKLQNDLGTIPVVRANNLSELFGLSIFLKNESQNPTGSFKDKEYLLVTAIAKKMGNETVACASSGNAAVALSSYAAKLGLKCIVFVPLSIPKKKLIQIKQFGAEIEKINGTYEDVFKISNKIIKENNWYNCNPGINPFISEADKITAYEIYKSFGCPDKIILPLANGTNIAGIWKGFKELKAFGKIEKLPSMIGVQIKGGDPITQAFKKNLNFPVIIKNPISSIAESIVATESYDGIKALKAVYESNGYCISVTDPELKEAYNLLSINEGLLVEISSASVIASLAHLKLLGLFKENDQILCIITGHGLKNTDNINEEN